MNNNTNLRNPFQNTNTKNFYTLNSQCNIIFYNHLVSMNPNVLALKGNIPKCPICLGYLNEPVKPNGCPHIFCKLCLEMWIQKKDICPLCRKKINNPK